MKKTITILFIFICAGVSAQLKVIEPTKHKVIGEHSDMMGNHMKYLYAVIDGDTVYSIVFRNRKYTEITDMESVSFAALHGENEALYKILNDSFSEENKGENYKFEFTLGSNHVILSHLNGMSNWTIFWTDKGYFYFKQKHLDKLFGKL